MGLSYLSKKSWHPGSFQNIEKVWMAEQSKKDEERRQADRIKKLKEEKQIEELKLIQIKEGVIPESALQRLDWMYQDRSAANAQTNVNQSEKFLLGESVKNLSKENEEKDGRKKIIPCIRDTYATPENEAFLKMMEDPLLYIKQKELEARNQVYDNPLKMKQIKAEIQALKEGKKHKKHKKDKKKKKHKKDKKEKKSSRHSSRSKHSKHSSRHDRSDSEDSSRSRSSSSDSDTNAHSEKSKSSKHSHHSHKKSADLSHSNSRKYSRSRSRSDSPKREDKIKPKESSNLGPDMGLYGERQRQLDESERLKKKQLPSKDVKKMTEEERLQKIREMQDYSKKLDEEKNIQLFGQKDIPSKELLEQETKKDARFLKDINKQAYLDSDMKLDERLNRKAHYRERDTNRD